MRREVKNLFKSALAFALIIMLILPNIVVAYGEEDKVDNSKTYVKSFKIYDGVGNVIEPDDKGVLSFAGSDLSLEYIIQPAEIKRKDSGGSFDVTFVADMTYGMRDPEHKVRYIDSELKFENFLEGRGYKKFTNFKDFNKPVSEGGAVRQYTAAGLPMYEVVGKGYVAQFLSDLEYYFNKEIKNKVYFVKTSNSEGVWYNESEARANYEKAKNSEVLKYIAVQNSVRAFVDKINKTPNYNARISIVPFDKRVDSAINFREINDSNLLNIYNDINILNPKEYIQYSQPNGGDGLRYTYHLNKNNNKGLNKYVIYLTDGTSNSWSCDDGEYNFFTGQGITNDVENTFIRTMLSNRDPANYGDYYIKYIANNLIGSDNLIKKSYVIGIGDDNDSVQKEQNKSVASILNGYVDYVINKGPGDPVNSSNTKITYNNGATAQNINGKIADVYYPLGNNAEGIQQVFLNIADSIIQDVAVTNAKVEIPFMSRLETESAGTLPDAAFVLANFDNKGNKIENPIVEEVKAEVGNGNTTYEKVNDIKSKFKIEMKGNKYVLKGDLVEGFRYTFDKNTNTYKANPIRITIKLKTSEENKKKNGLEIDKGNFVFDVAGETYDVDLSAKKFGIRSKIINLIEAEFVIDEFENTANLKMKPLDEYAKISLVDKDKNILNTGWHYTKPTKEKEINHSMWEVMDKLRADKCFYIEVELKGSGMKLYERVEVLTNEGVNNFKVNSANSDGKFPYEKEIGFMIGADSPDNIENSEGNKVEFIIGHGGKKSEDSEVEAKLSKDGKSYYYEYNMTLLDQDVLKEVQKNGKVDKKRLPNVVDINAKVLEEIVKEATDANGRNKVSINIENSYENVTVLKAAVTVNTIGPVIDEDTVEIIETNEGGVKKSILKGRITKDSKELSSVKIKFNGVTLVGKVIDNDRKGFEFDITGKEFKKYEIDATDINNNRNVTAFKMQSEIKTGVYVEKKESGKVVRDIIENSNVMLNARTKYAIDLNYDGDGKIVFKTFYGAKKPLNISVSKVSIYDENWNLVSESKLNYKKIGENGIEYVGNNLGEGKYRIVMDIVFKGIRTVKIDKFTAETTYKGDTKIDNLGVFMPSIL